MDQNTQSSPRNSLRPGEREATDQPPPTAEPWTPRQIRGLVIPGVILLLLLAVLLWGLFASAPHTPAVAVSVPTATPTTSLVAPTIAANATATLAPTAAIPVAAAASPTAGPADSPVAPPTAAATALPSEAPVATATAADPTALPSEAPTAVASADASPAPTGSAAAGPSPMPPTPSSSADPQHPLLGHRIGLDPGHGPRDDLGAVLVDPNTGKLILSEDELNLDVALRTAALLRGRGAEVVLTRETKDSFTAPWPPDTNGDGIKMGQSDDLQERVDIINDFHADVFLSIHANSSANPAKRKGIQALYCGGTGLADCPMQDQEIRLGKITLAQLADHLAAIGYPVEQSELRNDLWQDTPNDPMQHLFLLGPANPPTHPRAMHMPGIIVESLYVTSPTEAAELKQDDVRQAIALAYADALQQYFTEQP